MTKVETVIRELERTPEPLLGEILDFVRFVNAERTAQLESALLSEQVLAKDWLSPEEDEAWQDL